MQSSSDLREHQRRTGAVFAAGPGTSAAEQRSPLHFGNPRQEYAAATTGAAVIDWSDRSLLEVSGADRVAFLHNFCTNDVKRLSVGHGCEAFITNVKGRILGYVWIDVGEASIWLDAGPVAPDRLIGHLERYIINEDVTITDRTPEWAQLLVIGPAAAATLTEFATGAKHLSPGGHVETEHGSRRMRVTRRDVGNYPAYVLSAPRASLGELWKKLSDAEAQAAGSVAWSALRIEAGLPVFGVDLTEDNLAQEAARTREAISFTKGCYLGQEPIARIDAIGHVNRELRALRIGGEAVPASGAGVFTDATSGQSLGTVTSAAFSFGSESAVALALLRSSASASGSVVFVEIGASRSPATVFWFADGRRA
jgi:tRNA-modifying protein YgfZ